MSGRRKEPLRPLTDGERLELARLRATLPAQLPPLRVLLVLDNLAGHKTPGLVLWLFAHGVMPLHTPLGGSWPDMAERIQRVPRRRAPDGGPRTAGPGRRAPGRPGRHHRPLRDGRAALERGPQPRSSGAASGPPAGHGSGSGGTPWVDREP